MRIYLMTRMEGVCGVLEAEEWLPPSGRYHFQARRLLTLEVNAAVDGFYSAGATSVLVVDGHPGGGLELELLDRRTLLLHGFPGPYPFGLDRGFDCMAWVGQHAKAGSDHAHLPHTGGYEVRDSTLNGTSVGELGLMAFYGASIGVPSVFASGDEALCREARALMPAVETASVKRGLTPGSGDELDPASYRLRNTAALHLHPEKAREIIRNGAAAALARLRENKEAFPLLSLEAPFVRTVSYRAEGKKGPHTRQWKHPTDLLSVLNTDAGGGRLISPRDPGKAPRAPRRRS